MHLQRVQVPDFRVLKDVDITFEKNFNPRVFPLGSQNGGGKSTLLQLIFVLLHCSTNPDRYFAIKNLLNNFTLREDEDKRVLAIIDIWDGEKTINLEFFIGGDAYLQKILNTDANVDSYPETFFILKRAADTQQRISGFTRDEEELKNIIEQFGYRQSETTPLRKFPDDLKKRLLDLGIDFDAMEIELSDPDSLSKINRYSKTRLLNHQKRLLEESEILSDRISKIIEYLKLEKTIYIDHYFYNKLSNELEIEALLCRISNLEIEKGQEFLNNLSNKIFLTAPSTQIFLFLSRAERNSLFTNKNMYQVGLTRANSFLSGLFTYDFLSTDILIQAFKNARDKDFKEALKTGEYGNNYKKLLQNLDFLLHDKQVNLTDDFSGLTFKLDRFKDSIELYPEDLSHGELKRLSIYVWLKYQNIEDSIVLMDEVDLALHPDWQYNIVSDLVEWEPSNQYILATHSYELCQALTPSHVKVLEPKLTERRSD